MNAGTQHQSMSVIKINTPLIDIVDEWLLNVKVTNVILERHKESLRLNFVEIIKILFELSVDASISLTQILADERGEKQKKFKKEEREEAEKNRENEGNK